MPTDVQTGEALSAEDRAKLDHEVSEFSKHMESFWKSKADAKDWDQVKADLKVYVLAGEKVTEDPRRTAEYKAKVVEGLRLEDTSHTEDLAAIEETVSRKAAGFWVEGTARTTVRKFAHDCVPTGPPVSSQPHSLRREAAQWVDDRLEGVPAGSVDPRDFGMGFGAFPHQGDA